MNDVDFINEIVYNIEENEEDIYFFLEEYYIVVKEWDLE